MTFRDVDLGDYNVVDISMEQLVLRGGGDFFDGSGDPDPDDETRAEAERIAALFEMEITHSAGAWWGYSEMTPDPGDVSIFQWRLRCGHDDCKEHPGIAKACAAHAKGP